MYFPFFIPHNWGKRSAEERSSHNAVLPYTLQSCFVYPIRTSVL